MNAAPENIDWARVLPLAPGALVAHASANGLLALDKPAGVMTHPNKEQDRNSSLLRAAYNYDSECYQWTPSGPDDPGRLYLVNRIDSPTSGLVLAALNEEAASVARRAFAEGRAHKIYVALVCGRPRPHEGVWADQLARMPKGSGGQGVRMIVSPVGPGQLAKTHYDVIESAPNLGGTLSLLRLEPITGRTHQLRVQCAFRQNPIVGDATYGDFAFNREFARRVGFKRLFLHSGVLRIPSLGFSAESPVPEEFYEALGSGQHKHH